MKVVKKKELLKRQILEMVEEYFHLVHKTPIEFVPGNSPVNYAGRVFNEIELMAAVNASLDFWLTLGPEGAGFEKEMAELLGVRHVALTNSGSSANLLAFTALTSSKLKSPIRPGDEVITVSAGFPTTINPIIQNGCIPVFVDISLPTANIDVSQLKKALSKKTRAVMLAHTLGNPFDLDAVSAFCRDNDLYLIEDNCDALGSLYRGRLTGTFGHLGTSSFFPAHHITMGEGGAVYSNDAALMGIVESFRDWGRDCRCAPGSDNTCRNRFNQQFGDLPMGYDHKYVYSHIGYNLKPTDIQAAIGRAQLKKLPSFVEARKRNWKLMRDGLDDLGKQWHFMEPTPGSDPNWFGFLMVMKKPDHERLTNICRALESKKIGNRRLFGGNLIWQPAYKNVPFRVVDPLANSEKIALGGLFLGVFPGLSPEMIQYQIETFREISLRKNP